MEINESVSDLEGTILWICRSPLRKNHPRKNRYIDVSVLNETELPQLTRISMWQSTTLLQHQIRVEE
jgi:peptide chain release factor